MFFLEASENTNLEFRDKVILSVCENHGFQETFGTNHLDSYLKLFLCLEHKSQKALRAHFKMRNGRAVFWRAAGPAMAGRDEGAWPLRPVTEEQSRHRGTRQKTA